MDNNQQRRFHTNRSQEVSSTRQDTLKHKNQQLSEENRHLSILLISFLGLSANYLVELERLQSELDRLSSLPFELNAWYNKYSRVRIECLRLRGRLVWVQTIADNRIQELDDNVDRLIWICYNLEEQLRVKSIVFGFSYHSYDY